MNYFRIFMVSMLMPLSMFGGDTKPLHESLIESGRPKSKFWTSGKKALATVAILAAAGTAVGLGVDWHPQSPSPSPVPTPPSPYWPKDGDGPKGICNIIYLEEKIAQGKSCRTLGPTCSHLNASSPGIKGSYPSRVAIFFPAVDPWECDYMKDLRCYTNSQVAEYFPKFSKHFYGDSSSVAKPEPSTSQQKLRARIKKLEDARRAR